MQTTKPALRLAHFIFGRVFKQGEASRKFDINKHLQKNHVYALELFLYTWGWRENNISLVTHGHTIFPKAICVLVFPILQTEFKTFNQIVLRKERRVKNPHNTFNSGTISGKTWRKILQKLKQWWAWEIELIACYITVRIPPNSLISPGCCMLQVCAPTGVYKSNWR